MGRAEKARKIRILTDEELSFKRRSLMKRVDQVYEDVYREYRALGAIYLHNMSLYLLEQIFDNKEGC